MEQRTQRRSSLPKVPAFYNRKRYDEAEAKLKSLGYHSICGVMSGSPEDGQFGCLWSDLSTDDRKTLWLNYLTLDLVLGIDTPLARFAKEFYGMEGFEVEPEKAPAPDWAMAQAKARETQIQDKRGPR